MNSIEANKKTLSLIRFSFWLNVVLAFCVVALSIGVVSLFPLKSNTPYLVRFSDLQNSFVSITKADETLQSNQALIKYLLDAYVVNRETIDRATHNERRSLVLLYSSAQEQVRYSSFLLSNKETIETQSFFRSVDVLSVVNVSKSVAIVEFSLKDTYENSLQNIAKFKATIKFGFKQIKLERQNEYKNPVGLLVEEYEVTSIKQKDNE